MIRISVLAMDASNRICLFHSCFLSYQKYNKLFCLLCYRKMNIFGVSAFSVYVYVSTQHYYQVLAFWPYVTSANASRGCLAHITQHIFHLLVISKIDSIAHLHCILYTHRHLSTQAWKPFFNSYKNENPHKHHISIN